jgi:biotin carboxyl carrier protein
MTTTYRVTVGEQVRRVTIRRAGDAVYVSIDDGPEYPTELQAGSGGLYGLVHGDRRIELAAQPTDDGATLSIGGVEYVAEVVDEARARLMALAGGRTASSARRELKAPMPGLLVRVLCEPGQTVEAGQPLVVLQAMKMENELSLPRAGTVTRVEVVAGATVEQGQVLVIVE